MIIVTQAQLRNKDTEAIILLRNEIKASFNTNAIDYFTISAIAEILYNKLKPIVTCEYVIPSIAINASSRKKIVSLANLMDIARYFNGDWNYNANSDECGYMIAYDKTTTDICGYQVININADTDMYFGNVMFKNEADAQYVICLLYTSPSPRDRG